MLKLRLKLFIIMSIIVGALITTMSAFSYTAVEERYSLLERQEVSHEMQRVSNFVSIEMERIHALNWDWASWDDTYAFALNTNAAYIESNLHPSTFSANRINMILLYDTSGNLVIGRAYDIDGETTKDIPQAFLNDVNELGILSEGVGDSKYGLISLPEGVLMFSSRPILTTTDEGPSHGTLMMGRFIDEQELHRISDFMALSVDAEQIGAMSLPADYKAALQALNAENTITAIPVNANEISGYTMLTDYHGQPALIMKITLPRTIYQEGQRAVETFILFFIVVGVVVGGAGLLVNDYLFVKPITSLSERVDEIGRRKTFDERLDADGDDERASLARDINGMLDSLKEAREKELEQRTEVEGMRREHFREMLLGASKVINSVRYDLRSPLQVIRNATYLLREDPKRVEDLTDMIDESVENAVATIEDLSSKTQTGEMKITVTDLRYVIEMSIEMAKIPGNISVSTRFEEEFLAILLDVAKFQRVMDNLIRNAVEAMPSGGTLTIGTQRVGDDIQITVQDTGVGIKREDMGKLFQPFYTTKTSGSGLGLVNSRAIVEALGGQIMIQSTPGEGTTVTVVLPNKGG